MTRTRGGWQGGGLTWELFIIQYVNYKKSIIPTASTLALIQHDATECKNETNEINKEQNETKKNLNEKKKQNCFQLLYYLYNDFVDLFNK